MDSENGGGGGGGGLHNFIRLSLLLDHGSEILRQLFRDRYHLLTATEWTDSPSNGQALVKKLGKSFETLRLRKIQKAMVTSGNLDTWDLSTLATILKLGIIPPGQKIGGDRMKKENLRIRQLNAVRNVFAHLPRGTVSDTQFRQLWTKAVTALRGLGGGGGADDDEEGADFERILHILSSKCGPVSGQNIHLDDDRSKKIEKPRVCPRCSVEIVQNLHPPHHDPPFSSSSSDSSSSASSSSSMSSSSSQKEKTQEKNNKLFNFEYEHCIQNGLKFYIEVKLAVDNESAMRRLLRRGGRKKGQKISKSVGTSKKSDRETNNKLSSSEQDQSKIHAKIIENPSPKESKKEDCCSHGGQNSKIAKGPKSPVVVLVNPKKKGGKVKPKISKCRAKK